MTKSRVALFFLLAFALQLTPFAQTNRPLTPPAVTAPESVLGFKIGAERKLAAWEKFVAYFQKLAQTSDRVKFAELGKTTLKRPFIVATISSPQNLARLDELREIQRKLADPRLLAGQSEAAVNDLIRAGKTIVVITCSIHSNEVGGTFSGTELAYQLASQNTPEIQSILDNVVLFLVPSLNPDGTDIVNDWYQKTLGTPSEGTIPPQLYHYYTGHDNNRDWYAFTQIETQLTVDKLLNIWHPQILHDVHQMGGAGARFFLPPYIDPWEPNIDPALIAGVSALGTNIAWELTAQGKSGIVVNGVYDSWTPARAWAHYHAGLRILSETASARLATPVTIAPNLLGPGLGYNAKVATWNFPKPWPGGRWTLRDIIDYQTAGELSLLTHAARYRELHLRNFYEVGKRAIEAKDKPYALLLLEPETPKSLADAFKGLKEDLKKTTGSEQEKHEQSEALIGKVINAPSSSEEVGYYYKTEGIDRVVSILRRGGVEVKRAAQDFTADGKRYKAGTRVILMQQPYAAFAKALLERQVYPDLREYPGGPPRRPYDVTAQTLPLMMNVEMVAVRDAFTTELRGEPTALTVQGRVRPNAGVRLGIYQNYLASMDEGWTRWMFDQYRFPYQSLHDADIRAGNLRAKYDVILLPDQSTTAITNGLTAASSGATKSGDEESAGGYPAEFAGGLGDTGVTALKEFVAAGGTVITFNNASNFAIDKLGVPARNVTRGVSARDFYCPGSILKVELDAASPLTFGMEKTGIAWFEASPAFEITDLSTAKAIARYPDGDNPLLSGWILGDKLLRGRAALVEAKLGQGRVIMFGFRPQYRGQTLATFPLIFNAILTSKAE